MHETSAVLHMLMHVLTRCSRYLLDGNTCSMGMPDMCMRFGHVIRRSLQHICSRGAMSRLLLPLVRSYIVVHGQ